MSASPVITSGDHVVHGYLATEAEPLIEARFEMASRPDPIEAALVRQLEHAIARRLAFGAIARSETTASPMGLIRIEIRGQGR